MIGIIGIVIKTSATANGAKGIQTKPTSTTTIFAKFPRPIATAANRSHAAAVLSISMADNELSDDELSDEEVSEEAVSDELDGPNGHRKDPSPGV